MINPHQFISLILEPALKATGMYSIDAMYLMTCTAFVESKLTHLKQLPEGPALGFMQIEPATYKDIYRYLALRPQLRSNILNYTERTYLPYEPVNLIGDLSLNVLIARVKYWMQPEAIPTYKDPISQANYYERYYNANASNDKSQEFIKVAGEIGGWINHGDTET